jgi:hypothetical protein
LLWTITSVGRFTRAMVCAIVKVLPDPVTPSSTWCGRRVEPSVNSPIARGWSPASAKSDTS